MAKKQSCFYIISTYYGQISVEKCSGSIPETEDEIEDYVDSEGEMIFLTECQMNKLISKVPTMKREIKL